ncbi:MAG TPA: glutamine synthetase family protein [Pseudonocardiaceae bacterium]|jgi:glutamine synthetase|nr:glutamine synthetase family protein [Pseudonocardiaceae bacterium]
MTDADTSPAATAGIGRRGFVAEHGLHTAEQQAAAAEVINQIERQDIRTVRVIVVDQHGSPRAKFLSPHAAIAALTNGVDFSGAIYSMDTGNFVFPPAFAAGGGFGIEEFTGFPDVVIVPDPTTFRVLPWAPDTAWLLCDAYFASGRPVPLDARRILRNQLDRLAGHGLTYVTGLEVEFYVTRRQSPAIGLAETTQPAATPLVEPFELGYQYLSEVRLDSVNDLLTVLRDQLAAVGLAPRAMEDEWGPGQLEFSFSPMSGLASADAMVLFRSAVKQICARQGLLATFMCKPRLPNFFASGWHLHSSLVDAAGANAFRSEQDILSDTGRRYVAGLLDHAPAMTAIATPTINGYSRFAPYSFAPDRLCWAVENRGALVRVQGGPGDPGTHLENRLGEPAANPYLYLAADLAAGLDGIERELTPPAPIEADPYAADAPALPATLGEALAALDKDPLYRERFGTGFVDYYLMMKRSELARHESALDGAADRDAADAAWQMREYFEFY